MVILNYNGRHHLDGCLTALLANEVEGGYEVLVVDNNSTDGSVPYLRERWPQVRVIEAGGNRGFAGGNNLGMEHAQGDHIVLLNNDTRVRGGWLQALIDAADHDPSAGAVTSKLVYLRRPSVIQNAGSVLLSDGSGADRGDGEEDRGQYDRREEVFAACGCAVLYRRQMLDEVGRFDPIFFLYYEDTDLSWRMRLRGWKVLYEPSAVVEHLHSGTSGEWSPLFTFHVDRNRLFMILKNAPPGFVLRAYASLVWTTLSIVVPALARRLRGQPPREAPRSAADGSSSRRMPPIARARVAIKVVGSFLRHAPAMLRRRRSIRRRKVVGDAEIMRWFIPRERWHANS